MEKIDVFWLYEIFWFMAVTVFRLNLKPSSSLFHQKEKKQKKKNSTNFELNHHVRTFFFPSTHRLGRCVIYCFPLSSGMTSIRLKIESEILKNNNSFALICFRLFFFFILESFHFLFNLSHFWPTFFSSPLSLWNSIITIKALKERITSPASSLQYRNARRDLAQQLT